MKIIEVEIKKRTPNIINQLLTVWESSVRATHLFLSDSEIKHIKEYVPQALMGIAHLMIAKNDMGCPVAFMGIEDAHWKCCSFPRKKEERVSENACSNMGLKPIP